MGKQVLAAVLMAIMIAAGECGAGEADWADIGAGHRKIGTVLADQRNPQELYFGSGQGVFFSSDGGGSWSNVFSLQGEDQQVNALAFGTEEKDSLFAATGNGLFYCPARSGSWNRIFRGKNSLEKDCRALAVFDDRILLGTKGGLFISFDRGKNWKKQAGELGHSGILGIVSGRKNGGVVYAASVTGLFRSRDGLRSWERIFVASAEEGLPEQEEEAEEQEEEPELSVIRRIAVDPVNDNRVYLATGSGVLQSEDGGGSWKKITGQGLLEKQVRRIVAGRDSRIFAATSERIYRFNGDSWQELSVRLCAGTINELYLDAGDDLLAAAEKGLFRSSGAPEGAAEESGKAGYGKKIHPISRVQEAAMKFAEVDPEKIREWRRLAGKKAWLPQMNVGFNRDAGDLWHWETGSSTKECDDSLRKGRDTLDWDVSLTWNLGDIVWNDAQTSIDVRSRLNAQLRNDILDEVTKLYFERVRVVSDLDNPGGLDRKKRKEKELRIKELDAYLDALTGGFFSR